MPFSNSAAYIGHDFFWTIKAESRCKVIVHCAHSAIAYDDFIERESGLYRLALLLGHPHPTLKNDPASPPSH